jgi:hypothetical protein
LENGVRTLHLGNLLFQVALGLALGRGVYLARKKKLRTHCTTMRVLVPLQLLAIASVMLPSLLLYLRNPPPRLLLRPELLVHHTLGLVVVAIFAYVNLVFIGWIGFPASLKPVMRVAALCWVGSLLLGLNLFLRVGR